MTDFQNYFKDKKVTLMGLGLLGNPSVFRHSLKNSLTAFRHGEPHCFLTGTVHSMDFLIQKISLSLAKLHVFASHPTPSFVRATLSYVNYI